MTLPNFLGIGAPRSGSTWLHELLGTHPDVYVPVRRKEIRFFDVEYDRGLSWYEAFFPSPAEALRFQAIGEISPYYYFDENSPSRIHQTLPGARLLTILRNPADRLYSQYGFWVQRRGFKGSFDEFISFRPQAVELGFYARGLDRYEGLFPPEQNLILVFEDSVRHPDVTKDRLAAFLSIPRAGFPGESGSQTVNPSSGSRSRVLYSLGARGARGLRNLGMDRAVDLIRNTGVEGLFRRGTPLPPMTPSARERLNQIYRDDMRDLQERYQLDLTAWVVDSDRSNT